MSLEFIHLLELARNGIVAIAGLLIVGWEYALYMQYQIIKTLSNDEELLRKYMQENAKLRGALAFYALADNYQASEAGMMCCMAADGGRRASEALSCESI